MLHEELRHQSRSRGYRHVDHSQRHASPPARAILLGSGAFQPLVGPIVVARSFHRPGRFHSHPMPSRSRSSPLGSPLVIFTPWGATGLFPLPPAQSKSAPPDGTAAAVAATPRYLLTIAAARTPSPSIWVLLLLGLNGSTVCKSMLAWYASPAASVTEIVIVQIVGCAARDKYHGQHARKFVHMHE